MFYHCPFPGPITLESDMKSHSSAPRWAISFVLLALLVLGLLFVPECDDCYFIFWKFDSWQDLLLTQPNTQDALVVGVPHNGRYLGNLLGVLQAKLYVTPLAFLRGVLLGGALIALVLLLARRFRSKAVGRGEAFLLSAALVVISSRGLWQQVYSWGAALVNYLLPMLGLLILLGWMEKNPKRPTSLARTALLALACCLFMETVTIYLALAAFAVLVWAWFFCRDRLPGATALALGSWLGAAIMFLSPGYAQTGSDTRSVGLELAREGRFDLILLDVMMPEMDGLEACMKIREFSNVPIIMLTAKSEDADKLMGFECGADDYLTKPFNILELKARVRALLRRAAGVQRSQGGLLAVGKLTLDTQERVAIRDGQPVDLTAKEYDLIELLMRNPRRVYSRENLMNVVWGYTYAGDYRTVDVHIRRLREKLEENPAEPEHIMTKWGVGYYFKG